MWRQRSDIPQPSECQHTDMCSKGFALLYVLTLLGNLCVSKGLCAALLLSLQSFNLDPNKLTGRGVKERGMCVNVCVLLLTSTLCCLCVPRGAHMCVSSLC